MNVLYFDLTDIIVSSLYSVYTFLVNDQMTDLMAVRFTNVLLTLQIKDIKQKMHQKKNCN